MLNFRIEKRLKIRSGKIILGMDEAGRGPIAGPVAVGAVLVDANIFNHIREGDVWWRKINDSKKLAPPEREKLYQFINKNVPCGVGMVSAKYIDRYGINKAIKRAATLALKTLKVEPGIILQDGNRKFLKIKNCSQRTITKGDGRLWSIACASIVAKVSRDHYMNKISRRYPKYNFDKHKGYGTKLHFSLLEKYGPCRLHRFSFAPLRNRGSQKSSWPYRRGNAHRQRAF